MSEAPILFTWDGEAMYPRRGAHARECDNRFVVGESYLLTEWQERSTASHNHFFAEVAEAWKNLPDVYRQIYPTPEHLRKRALVVKGWHTVQEHVCASKAEAERAAVLTRALDEYSVVTVSGTTAVILRPRSQKMRAMGKKDFQQSKDDVLAFCSELIGVTPQELAENTGKAA